MQSEGWFRWIWAGSLSVAALCAQSSPPSQPVAAAFQEVSAAGSLFDEGLKPWHLKMSVTVVNAEGKLESGTFEEWHNGPKQWRCIYDLPSYRGSRVHADDSRFATAGLSRLPFPLEYLQAAELYQVPKPKEWEGAGLQTIATGLPSQFTCVAVAHGNMTDEQRAHDSRPAFCFDAKMLRLEVVVQYHSLVTIRNQVGTFLGRSVPTQLTVTADGKSFASAKVLSLQARTEPYLEASVTDGLERQDELQEDVMNQPVMGGIVAGALLQKVQPIYPQRAKAEHISGTVWLHAIIGRNGRVQGLTVITTPSQALSEAAVTAVKAWVYRPYLLNGVPAEVNTTVAVNFSLGT